MYQKFVNFWIKSREEGERGAATTEYALILALVVVILIGTLQQLGGALNNRLTAIINQITQAR